MNDPSSFESFYRSRYRELVGLAVVLTGNSAVAEDIAQEALLAAFRSWSRVSGLDNPSAWVKRVVANKSVSIYRRRQIEVRSLSSQAVEHHLDPGEHRTDLWSEVRKLPKRQAVAVALRYLSDLTLDEIAEVMHCSKSTANTHLRRAHQRLAEELGTEWKEDW